MDITLCQMNPDVGDIEGNTERIIAKGKAAFARGSQIVIFPELAVPGYYPGDLLDRQSFRNRMFAAHESILAASCDTGSMHWVFGNAYPCLGPSSKLSNNLVVVSDGVLRLSQAKQLLPTYSVFDERRHFEPGGSNIQILKIANLRVGFLICEDAWWTEKLYTVNPLRQLLAVKPDLIISINASPSDIGKRAQRMQIFVDACQVNDVAVVYVNQVGGQDQIVYDGGSFCTTGFCTLEYKQFAEQDCDVLLVPSTTPVKAELLSLSGELETSTVSDVNSPNQFYYRQIILGLRDYARRCGFAQALVGCSGGIDSALTLALAADALGPGNVLALTMPSRFSSTGSVVDSEELCKNLGVKLMTHPIGDLHDLYLQKFLLATGSPLTGVAAENVQARIRGTILMELSNEFGHLLLTTGNKSEIAVGYCTLYGDTNGGLGLIGDLYKTEVFALAGYYNRLHGQNSIPMSILDKPPSAELAADQKDSDSLPPYPVLDAILRYELEGKVLSGPGCCSANQATINKIRMLIAKSEYKRKQAPPIIRVHPIAFGSGRQIPITAKQW